MGNAARDQNYVPTLIGVSNADGSTPVTVYVDPTTHRLLVSSSAGSGTVTSVSVVTANGVSGSVATSTTTPAITLTLGAITPTTVRGLTITTTTGTLTLANGSTLATSGANSITLTSSGATNVTLPTTGTLATLAGSEALTGKTVNGLTITSSTGTLTITNAKVLSVSNTLTFTGTDSSTVACGAGGTVAYVANKLSVFAATTSAELAGVISDETGSGALVFGTNPTIAKPVLNATNPTAQTYSPAGAATATLDLALANQHDITMPAGNITVALSNATNNQVFMVSILQDGVGSRTVTWFSTIRWAGGSPPTLTTTASKRDRFGFIRTGSGTYDGFVIGQNI
jgi:hypothetical protein